jgi:DNA-binding transcriptional MocR family regulator
MAEIAATWIADGTGDRLARERRAESIARQEIARAMLSGDVYTAHPAALHGWLSLPEPWNGEDFAARAKARGVLVTPGEAFAVGRAYPAIRVCLGAARGRAELKAALSLLAGLMHGAADDHLSVI